MFKNSVVFIFCAVVFCACGHDDNTNSRQDPVKVDEANCSREAIYIDPNSDKYNIDTYFPLQCQNSNSLNGVWLAVSDLREGTYLSIMNTQIKRKKRELITIEELENNRIVFKYCNKDDQVWELHDDVLEFVENNLVVNGVTRDVSIESFDKFSMIESSSSSAGVGRSGYSSYEDTQLIKVDTLKALNNYGIYTGHFNFDENTSRMDNSIPIACFSEVFEESEFGNASIGGPGLFRVDYKIDIKPRTETGYRLLGVRDSNKSTVNNFIRDQNDSNTTSTLVYVVHDAVSKFGEQEQSFEVNGSILPLANTITGSFIHSSTEVDTNITFSILLK